MNDDQLFTPDLEHEVRETLQERAIAAHEKTQSPTNAWEAIMEESTHRSRGISRRAQLLSAAAVVALIVAITGAALVVTRSGDNDSINTVDNKKKETTQTTTPLTPEERLTQNAILLKREVSTDPQLINGGCGGYIPEFFNAADGQEIENFKSENVNEVEQPSISGSKISFVTTVGCDGLSVESRSFELDTNNRKTSISNTGNTKFWSPNNKNYLEVPYYLGGTPKASKLIVDGNEKTINPEKFEAKETQADGSRINTIVTRTIVQAIWLDSNRFLYLAADRSTLNDGTFASYRLDQWYLADASKEISLKSAKALKVFEEDNCPDDCFYSLYDARLVNGEIIALVSQSSVDRIAAINLSTNKLVWTLPNNRADTNFYEFSMFGNDTNEIYGSYSLGYNTGPGKAYAYDRNTDAFVKFDGALAIYSKK